MKKILLFVILLSVQLSAQITNWQGKTADQLSAMTAGTTNILAKSYWTTNAYAQIRDLYDIQTVSAITANDTTPLIGDAQYYYTANTSATDIDSLSFTGAYRKVIYIIIADNYTTFNHQASSLDCGGVDLAPITGDVMKCIYTGSKWQVKFDYLE